MRKTSKGNVNSEFKNGGHIGDGVRQSERKMGYAKRTIPLALEYCKNLNINRVLMVYSKDNIGGILETSY